MTSDLEVEVYDTYQLLSINKPLQDMGSKSCMPHLLHKCMYHRVCVKLPLHIKHSPYSKGSGGGGGGGGGGASCLSATMHAHADHLS